MIRLVLGVAISAVLVLWIAADAHRRWFASLVVTAWKVFLTIDTDMPVPDADKRSFLSPPEQPCMQASVILLRFRTPILGGSVSDLWPEHDSSVMRAGRHAAEMIECAA